jgi:hypothetical protein
LRVVDRTEKRDAAIASEAELRARVKEYHEDFQKEKEERFDITADMSRQYKSMQEELIARINQLENTIADLNDRLDLAHIALEETKHEKDAIIAERDAEIAELKQKMEDMSTEFSDMLRETLDKMRERVERSSTNYGDEGGLGSGERLKEFNLGGLDL